MSQLRIENLSHAFGDLKVLYEISLTVNSGEITSLLGPSGCGKTTLLRLAAGLEAVQSGAIWIGEETVANASRSRPPEQRKVGMVFQDYALFPHLSVLDNILFGVRKNVKERREWALEALEKTGLSNSAERFPHVLSGGQQQRVALLRALAAEPQVLLMDEPFSGLDVTLRAKVREETHEILNDNGVGALMVTHDPEEAMVMSDQILVMNDGHIVQSGDPQDIYWHPADAFVAGLFGNLNEFRGEVDNECVPTPLGCFEAKGMGNGSPVNVMFRPAALQLEPADTDNDELTATVIDYHLLGQATDVRLEFAMPDDLPPWHLKAWVPGVCRAPKGTVVSITVVPEKVFVFAR